MDLWIRSQDRKTLAKVENVWLSTDNNTIYINCPYDDYGLLAGRYQTNERAMMILDELTNILQPQAIYYKPEFDDNFIQSEANKAVVSVYSRIEADLKQSGQIVYQMPER